MTIENKSLNQVKAELIEEIELRREKKILEPENAKLLTKLIQNADTTTEALQIMALGTTAKRTGFMFDKRLEKMTSTIKYLKRNEKYSFHVNDDGITHKLIIGDNYPALQNLLITGRQVDVIYIDPPYGKDSMGEAADTRYENRIERDNLLSDLYMRLQLARRLLKNGGVIFCSIDDRNQAYVKGLFDEVFGENHFVGSLIWKTKTAAKGVPPVNMFIKNHDYILVYSKNRQIRFNGEYRNLKSFGNPDNDPRGVWKADNMKSTVSKNKFTITDPITGNSFTKNWAFSRESIEQMIAENKIVWPTSEDGTPRQKRFLNEMTNETTPFRSYLGEFQSETASNNLKKIFGGEKVFAFPKPVELIKCILRQTTASNSLILDFYAGSGTTAQAVMELNREDGGRRQCILCTNLDHGTDNEYPFGIGYDVTARRCKRIMTGSDYDGTTEFEWLNKNEPYMDNLDVFDICEVDSHEQTPGKTAFDVIDETCYGLPKFQNAADKIQWVCSNFENTCREIDERTD